MTAYSTVSRHGCAEPTPETHETMRITLINKSDSTGGAAVVSLRLVNALRDAGIDARMLVTEKRQTRHTSPSPHSR